MKAATNISLNQLVPRTVCKRDDALFFQRLGHSDELIPGLWRRQAGLFEDIFVDEEAEVCDAKGNE